MEDAVSLSYSTANALSTLPIKVAALVARKKITNALFIGYAPAQNPQIEILILVEDAKGSLNAIPIAKDVMWWYYENKSEINNER